MKAQFEGLQMEAAASGNPLVHRRVLRAVAFLRTTLLTAVCAATASIDVVAKNPPVAQSQSIDVGASVANSIVLQGSAANGDPVTFTVTSPPTNGILSGTAPNLTYFPFIKYLGADSFKFVVSDGALTSSPATVSITVKPGLLVNTFSIVEGNSGTSFTNFSVRVTAPVQFASFSFSTVDATAKAGSDYVATSGTISFSAPTVGSLSLGVGINGDTSIEQSESFLMQLSKASSEIVIVNGTGRCTIVNDDFLCCFTFVPELGTAALEPENSVVRDGEPLNLRLNWTHPVGWRQLDSVDLLLVDDEGESLVVRWHEAENSFSLFNPAADSFVRTAEAGSPARFEASAATLHLQDSTGGGPPGQTVTIEYSLSFKPQAAGRTFSVEAFATDDAGEQQGFESVGTITVLPHADDQ
jgi:hypothetical protein